METSKKSSLILRFLPFLERIKLIRQRAECHADDRDDDVGDGGPPLENFYKELQTEIVNQDIANCYKEIPDNLSPAAQSGARETNVTRHPEAREEGDGELEYEGGDVGRESNETEVEDLFAEDEMVEHIVQHPLQSQIQSAASRIAEQLQVHHLAKRRIEEVDELGQSAFYPGFYVAEE